jgi:hypothetical protein
VNGKVCKVRKVCKGNTGTITALSALALNAIVGCSDSTSPTNAPSPNTAQDDANPSPVVSAPRAESDVWFIDDQPASGIDFVHRTGHDGEYFFTPEIMSGGAAIIDIDNDGWMDVYLVQSGTVREYPSDAGRNRLFHNRGDGTFEDITAGSGADDPGFGFGVAAGDYDNDGDVDLYVANLGRNTLLRNNGDLTFTDVTEAAGVGDDQFGSSAAFVDLDNDDDLDLVVVNYLAWSVDSEIRCMSPFGEPDYCSPAAYDSPLFDTLYRNDGDGTFTDVSESAGFRTAAGTGLGIAAGDFNDDGLMDLFITNDGRDDHLWMNAGNLTFTEEAMRRGCAIDLSGKAKAGMGVTVQDIDGDDDLDVLVCNLRRESDSLFENDGGMFQDVTTTAGLAGPSRGFTRFGLGWVDFNNDGRLDVYSASGRVSQERDARERTDPFAEPNLLYEGTEDGRFVEVTPRGGVDASTEERTSRAAAFGDLNNDGGIDIIVINRDAPPHVLRNVVRDRGHWLMVRAVDKHGRDAIGATVWLAVDAYTREVVGRGIRRDVRSAYSYCASNDMRVHFGLGDWDATAERAPFDDDHLTVRWIDGSLERFAVPGIDRVITLRQGTGRRIDR